MTKKLLGVLAGALMSATTLSAQAAFIDINLAGFQSTAFIAEPGNTERFVDVGAGSMITGFDYLNLSFATMGTSWLSEFVISVNDSKSATTLAYMDWAPSLTDSSGTLGPVTGSFNGPTGDGFGGPFTDADGVIFVTTYELFDDAGIDATVSAGTLRIFYTPAAVPEPATYALLGMGLLGVGAAARRRRG